MSWFWLIVAFGAGWLACWKLSYWLMKKVFHRESRMLVSVIKGLGPDSFARLRKDVEAEATRRNALL